MKLIHFPIIIIFFFSFLITSKKCAAESFSPEKASFAVKVKGEEFVHKISPLFVLPAEKISFEFTNPGIKCLVKSGSLSKSNDNSCTWLAPSNAGEYQITLLGPKDSITFHVFVMLPFAKLQGEELNGYRIGSYPSPEQINNQKAYLLPRGFIEVTEKNKDVLLTPHFTLGQFICKQEGSYPKYIVLREQLLLKLEHILEEINQAGHKINTFVVMSGYRTPYYNEKIENVRYSRHVFGDAADVYLPHSKPKKDEKQGKNEINLLSRLVEKLEKKSFFKRFIGGMGIYNATKRHPPFLHVDVRGWPARW